MAKDVTTRTNAALPAFLDDVEMTGVGVATDSKDFLLPMARVLDAKSPEVTRGSPSMIAGAAAGDILIKNAPVPFIKGDEGMLFQPCYREEAVIEWRPRNSGGGGGSGFVERHLADYLTTSKDIEQRPHPENKAKLVWYRKSTGNLLVETRYVGGYMIADNAPPMPLVLPFASTGHSVAKNWNMLMAMKQVKGRTADIFAVYYRVKTRLRQRSDQAWYVFDISDAGPEDSATKMPATMWVPSLADYNRGKQLHDSLASGEHKVDVASTTDDQPSTQSDAM